MSSFPLDTCKLRNVCDTTARWVPQPHILLMLSFRHKTGSCHKTTSSSNPFTATKLDISLVFNQVQLVLTNALQLWKVSERISSCFAGVSDETFHMWNVLWDSHTAKAGKAKTQKESPWGAMYTLIQDARCVGCFKGKARIRSSKQS